MEMSVSSEMTFFTTKQQSEICPHLRTGSSAEDRGRIDTRSVCANFSIFNMEYLFTYMFKVRGSFERTDQDLLNETHT